MIQRINRLINSIQLFEEKYLFKNDLVLNDADEFKQEFGELLMELFSDSDEYDVLSEEWNIDLKYSETEDSDDIEFF